LNERDVCFLDGALKKGFKQQLPRRAILRAEKDAARFEIETLNESTVTRIRRCVDKRRIVARERVSDGHATTFGKPHGVNTGRLIYRKDVPVFVEKRKIIHGSQDTRFSRFSKWGRRPQISITFPNFSHDIAQHPSPPRSTRGGRVSAPAVLRQLR
jgi:hypothetical protein